MHTGIQAGHAENSLLQTFVSRGRKAEANTTHSEMGGPNSSSKSDLPLHKLLAHSKDSGWFILPLDPFFLQKLSPLFCAVHKPVTHAGGKKKKKKIGAGKRRRGREKRKSVTLRLAKASDQQQLPGAESLFSLPPGEWLPQSIQQKASFHRNWHKSGVIPSISIELLRIYGSVTQQAESCVLRATSPGFPAGDRAGLLFRPQCRPCNSTDAMACSIFPDAVISSRCSTSRTFGEIILFHTLQENFDNLWPEHLLTWINYFFQISFFPPDFI